MRFDGCKELVRIVLNIYCEGYKEFKENWEAENLNKYSDKEQAEMEMLRAFELEYNAKYNKYSNRCSYMYIKNIVQIMAINPVTLIGYWMLFHNNDENSLEEFREYMDDENLYGNLHDTYCVACDFWRDEIDNDGNQFEKLDINYLISFYINDLIDLSQCKEEDKVEFEDAQDELAELRVRVEELEEELEEYR